MIVESKKQIIIYIFEITSNTKPHFNNPTLT